MTYTIVVEHSIQFYIPDPDGVKVQLAQSELRDHSLLSLLETTSKVTGENEENQQLEKLAADLVVLLLTGGRSEHLEIVDVVITICTGCEKTRKVMEFDHLDPTPQKSLKLFCDKNTFVQAKTSTVVMK